MVDRNDAVGLADWIEQLRTELEAATKAGVGKRVVFEVDQIELEMELTVTSEKSANGGLKFWVLTANGAAKYGNGAKQRVKLSLTPKDYTGVDLQIADDIEGEIPR
jgi:lipopolysaccharide export system protein LptA